MTKSAPVRSTPSSGRRSSAAPWLTVLASVAALGLAACTGAPGTTRSPVPTVESAPPSSTSPSTPATAIPTPAPTPTGPTGPQRPTGELAAFATGLQAPWSIVPLTSGSVLISERDSALVKEVAPGGAIRSVGTVADVVPGGEGGLLGLAALQNGSGSFLYAYFTAAGDNRVVRMPLDGGPGGYTLGAPEPIFSGIPKAGNHNGGRIAFGPDGKLYLTAGDAGNRDAAQDLGALGGKILRLLPDGSVPADNPFPGSPVYSYGHRNPQGLAWQADGQLWASEFGQDTWDELNRIVPGGDYGWPVVEGVGGDPSYIDPVAQWSTDEASPSGLAIVGDTAFLASLRGERLWAVDLVGAVTSTPFFVGELGRIRDVVDIGDGSALLMLSNNTDGRGSPQAGDDVLYRVSLG
jgi:glucose/arabinose dehydrogenase